MYPALRHARQVVRQLLLSSPAFDIPTRHFIILHGETVQSRKDTDRELIFRQESNFYYLSGCDVAGAAITIGYNQDDAHSDFDEEKVDARLYLPAVVDEEVMWCGLPASPSELASKLAFTSIHSGWTPSSLFPRAPPPTSSSASSFQTIVYTLPWTAFDASLISTINGPAHCDDRLLPALHVCRRTKSSREVELMRVAAGITKGAHELLMREVGSGRVTDENEAEALFVGHCRRFGAKHQAYMPIVAAGSSAGTLHYVSNSAPFPTAAPGSLLLVDAGAEYDNYAADITRCIPIGNGGRFTKECREIYELVLEMQEAAFAIIKPGCDWEAVQRLMHNVVARGFLQLGIFIAPESSTTAESAIESIVASGLTSAFYPHGVGHLLGLDVHDVGGLPQGKSTDPLLRYLRLRVPLEVGFVVTVEPGIYFNEHLFKAFQNSPLVNHGLLSQYWYVGGIRIEDNLLITEHGFDNFSKDIAKTVAQVEAITTGQA